MRRLKVKVRDATVATRVPTLERWPRVSSLDLLLDYVTNPIVRMFRRDAEEDVQQPDLDAQMLLPVTRQPLACRQRITSLAGRQEHLDPVDPISPAAISALPLWFPSLKDLNLDLPIATSSSLQLRYMYDALATLPHLESLRVAHCAALEGIGALRSLKRLRLKDLNSHGCLYLPVSAIPDIISLQKLEILEVDRGVTEADFMCGLLRGCALGGLSISIHLDLRAYVAAAPEDVTGDFGFTFSAGVLKEVQFCGTLTELCAAATRVLRASPEVLPDVTVLRLSHVSLQAELLPEDQARMLRSDLKRFVRVEVQGLTLSSEPAVPSLAPLLQARQLFGTPRRLAWLSLDLSTATLTAAEQQVAAAQSTGGAAEPPPPPPCALPEPEVILQRAVDHLAAAARPDCLQPNANHFNPVLLARGSMIETLVHTPASVLPWLRELVPTSGSLPPGAKGEDLVAEVKVLPTAAAVLEMQRALDAGAAHGSDACLAWAVSVFAFLAGLP
ncbi:hypothetical protein HYH03_007044 [Edaphochlamys debaryana]|uniref:Uncharacterized protein n=1 Tax=Edaphochlamys debaryana TaxID=47281 RepID=A0A836BZH6_9CHLO|nr:hypothetical protein HYH03_007044 [Edaphochlamys debaryana]|eukprot:KAG2494801.1 hypothetical protein HYH03_007044 [Edaphochlamys debaryana]